VAMTLASFALFNADFHTDGPIHIKWGVTSARETLQILAHTAVAIDTNTDVLLGSMYYVSAGPCTEMCFLENAAQAIVDAVSGRELIAASASAKGIVLDKTTGMEARMAGKVAQAASGVNVDDANDILDSLISAYEPNFINSPEGKRFQDCYDLDSLRPTDEHSDTYVKAVDRIRGYGLDVRY
jgi:methylamine--corrinoid protein Co-methyltransferase